MQRDLSRRAFLERAACASALLAVARPAAAADGMYVSLYATLLGIATNLWLKINLRLLGRIDG